MKQHNAKLRSAIKSCIAPSTVMTAALIPSALLAGPGDLDPSFGNLGRLGDILDGPIWSVEPEEDGTMILGGGRPGFSYYYWGCCYFSPPTAFIERLSGDGVIDEAYEAPAFDDLQVRDIVRQPDGQVVAVGRRYLDSDVDRWQLAAYRVRPDGLLDTGFAADGLFVLPADEHGEQQQATSVVLDPEGRIVIGGSRHDDAIVLRLLPDGAVDDSFGTDGLFVGPDNFDYSSDGTGARTGIVRTADGSYRLSVSNAGGCQLVGLTADGELDDAFGNRGLATVQPAVGTSTNCNALALQTDDRLLVAGRVADRGFVTRLLPGGQPDPGWMQDAVGPRLASATAVAVGDDDSIVVGGQVGMDSLVLRLGQDGLPDLSFGNAGSTLIDLESFFPEETAIHDLVVEPGGSILAAGGVGAQAFVAHLLGSSGGNAAGIVGFTDYGYTAEGEGGEVVFTLRRTGGSSGEVSVSYTVNDEGWGSASEGADYELEPVPVTWADGDVSERQIRVPILADELVEDPEYFGIELTDVAGGAGLGKFAARGEIPADGSPFGQLVLDAGSYTGKEGAATVVTILRQYYASGAVSVTVTPRADTAEAGLDFDASPVTVSWADGDFAPKSVTIPIVDDTAEEAPETFRIDLMDATGGAVLANPSGANITILANDRVPAAPKDSGGGAIGWLSLLLLGAATLRRRVRYRLPRGMRERTLPGA